MSEGPSKKNSFDPIDRLDGKTVKKAARWKAGKKYKLVLEFTDGSTFECEANGEHRLTLKGGQHYAWWPRAGR